MRLMIAGPLLGMTGADVIAKNKGKGKGNGKKKGCKKNQKKCGKKCIPKDGCCSNKDCDACAFEVCRNNVCDCDDEAERSNGVCGVQPQCLSAGALTEFGYDSSCCSLKTYYDPKRGDTHCLPGKYECIVPYDCVSGGFEACKGFMCPELYFARAGVPCNPA